MHTLQITELYNFNLFWFQVRTTPHVSGTVNPVWETVVECMVGDFTKVRGVLVNGKESLHEHSGQQIPELIPVP